MSSTIDARKEQILRLALREASRRRRLRKLRRLAGFVAVMGLATWVFVQLRPRVTALQVVHINPPTASPWVIVRLGTDPTIAQRMALKPEPPRWQIIDDRELIDDMAAAGRPAGLIQMDGQTILLTSR